MAERDRGAHAREREARRRDDTDKRRARRQGAPRRKRLGWLGVSLGLGVGAFAARRLARVRGEERLRRVKQAVTIRREPREVYAFFRRFENLPRFMHYVDDVEELDERRSRWRVHGPAGAVLEWEAELVHERPGERLAWRSVEGADVENAGFVTFVEAPKQRGTEVYFDLHYAPPAGRLGAAFATLFRREPAQQAREDLRRLKQVLETGQVVHSDATVERGRSPARPVRGALRSDDETLRPPRDAPRFEGEPYGQEVPR